MKREELKAKVPHGYGEVIATRANVTKQAVSQFLNGKNNNVAIEMATLEVVAELEEKRRGLLARIQK